MLADPFAMSTAVEEALWVRIVDVEAALRARAYAIDPDVVLEIDETGRRIRLSVKAIGAAQEAAEVRDYTQRADASAPGRFGSLGDKLRGALDKK